MEGIGEPDFMVDGRLLVGSDSMEKIDSNTITISIQDKFDQQLS